MPRLVTTTQPRPRRSIERISPTPGTYSPGATSRRPPARPSTQGHAAVDVAQQPAVDRGGLRRASGCRVARRVRPGHVSGLATRSGPARPSRSRGAAAAGRTADVGQAAGPRAGGAWAALGARGGWRAAGAGRTGRSAAAAGAPSRGRAGVARDRARRVGAGDLPLDAVQPRVSWDATWAILARGRVEPVEAGSATLGELRDGSRSSLSSRAAISFSFGPGSRSELVELGAELADGAGRGRLHAFEVLLQRVDAPLQAADRVVLPAVSRPWPAARRGWPSARAPRPARDRARPWLVSGGGSRGLGDARAACGLRRRRPPCRPRSRSPSRRRRPPPRSRATGRARRRLRPCGGDAAPAPGRDPCRARRGAPRRRRSARVRKRRLSSLCRLRWSRFGNHLGPGA